MQWPGDGCGVGANHVVGAGVGADVVCVGADVGVGVGGVGGVGAGVVSDVGTAVVGAGVGTDGISSDALLLLHSHFHAGIRRRVIAAVFQPQSRYSPSNPFQPQIFVMPS